MNLEEENIEEELLENQYRDRAEERRKGYQQEIQGDSVQLEGFEKQIKLKGLDFSLIQQQNKQVKETTLDIITKIKKDLNQVKQSIPKKTTHHIALKLEAFMKKNKQNEQIPIAKLSYVYKYDNDPVFGQKMPQFITKNQNQTQEQQKSIIFKESIIELLKNTRIGTQEFSQKRYQDRHIFQQNSVLDNNGEFDDENIFDEAKQLNKPDININTILQVEQQNTDFDIKQYLDNNMFDQKTYNQLKNEVQKQEIEKEEKLKKYKKMLDENDDYYYECYQPQGLTIAEDKEHKEEAERKKQINPEFKEFDFIKKDKFKKKKKRENYDNQFDKIEDIIKKKNK